MTSGASLDVPVLISIIFLIILSAFFSMSRTAMGSVSETKLRTLVENRVTGSKKALHLAENKHSTLIALIIYNTVTNVVLTVLSFVMFEKLIVSGNLVELITASFAALIILVFCEIIPKSLGRKYSKNIFLKVSYLVYVLVIILLPIVWLFNALRKLIWNSETKSNIDEDQLEAILDTMEEEGSIESDEVEFIRNVFDLNDRTVEDIMVHRMDIVAIDVESSIEEIKNIFFENKFSRIPVYKEDKDHVLGILYERDFLSAIVKYGDVNILEIMRPVKYVSKSMTVDTLISELQKCKTHMAIVSGEYGDTLGIVTMEDALEEIVGEIYDEHDDDVSNDVNLIEKIGENTYIVDAEMYVDYLFDELEIGNAPEDTSQKISSWVFEESEEIPMVGNKVEIISNYTQISEKTNDYEDYSKKITFEISEVDDRRIKKVIVTVEDNEEIEEE